MELNTSVLWLWAKASLSYNNKKLLRLVDLLGSIEAVYDAEDYSSAPFLSAKEIKVLLKKDLREAWEVYGDCIENQIEIITPADEFYPPLLKEIANPPVPLFYKGHLKECLSRPTITIVGTRKCNGYGEEKAKLITSALCQCGFTVVCGLADGIDQFTYESAIQNDSGPLVVLPFGLLSSKGNLTRRFPDILARGALITEIFPRNGSHRFSYHERNRTLSGISSGTLVVQAPARSGALMTANYAIEQNRDLFAVMANDSEQTKGSNQLIKDGCYPVTEYTDILHIYLPQFGEQLKELAYPEEKVFSMQEELSANRLQEYKKKHRKELSEEEQIIFDLLDIEECTTDYLIETSALPVDTVLQSLTSLEFRGLAVSCPGSKFKVIL